jgi:hypothetical protein
MRFLIAILLLTLLFQSGCYVSSPEIRAVMAVSESCIEQCGGAQNVAYVEGATYRCVCGPPDPQAIELVVPARKVRP